MTVPEEGLVNLSLSIVHFVLSFLGCNGEQVFRHENEFSQLNWLRPDCIAPEVLDNLKHTKHSGRYWQISLSIGQISFPFPNGRAKLYKQ